LSRALLAVSSALVIAQPLSANLDFVSLCTRVASFTYPGKLSAFAHFEKQVDSDEQEQLFPQQ
jgi:hypothetical protein